ncbi:MAG: low-specificity L-threonine aldolase [Deltaproteobacteria bacterium]|nr:low-specificity L-threonine aldolase [Deltaproteobacteria bacterium]
MREAMARAEVGDDVFRDDPTVRALEEKTAAVLGKEAGLFTASGTMANLVAILTHCRRGDEVIMGDMAHTFVYEVGGSAALGGVHPRPLPNQPDGTILVSDIEKAIRPKDDHFPVTRLICLENSHNKCGGVPLSAGYMADAASLAGRHRIALHLDGARLFNAAAALGTDVKTLAAGAGSVGVCLSKGLSAPVGSVLCGTRQFVGEARRFRKMVGGGMRQAGIIAAAGIVALDTMVDRLAEDHANARRLAEGIAAVPGLVVPSMPQTNIVMFEVAQDGPTPAEIAARLKSEGVSLFAVGPRQLRAVTHYGITSSDIDEAIATFGRVMEH